MMATSRRIEQACWEPTGGPAGTWASQAGSLLAMAGQGPDAIEQGAAARTIVRMAFGRHGCVSLTPPPCDVHTPGECDCPPPMCEDPRHEDAVASALTALRVLGLTPNDPASRRHKRCSACKAAKPLDEFSSDPSSALGVHSVCKQCRQGMRRRRAARKATP